MMIHHHHSHSILFFEEENFFSSAYDLSRSIHFLIFRQYNIDIEIYIYIDKLYYEFI